MKLSVIIPVHNGAATLSRCLEALVCSEGVVVEHSLPVEASSSVEGIPLEVIVVDDNSTDKTVEIARKFPARVVSTNVDTKQDTFSSQAAGVRAAPRGPAYARNIGAAQASGEVLVFIDADVCVHPDTLAKIEKIFRENLQVAAIFGSYDDQPAYRDFFSQYKNLVHHFVHQNGQKTAFTFWSGCGAIRREIFLQVGGFDAAKYPQPSIEDIELGYRLTAAGFEIRLEKDIQVKHLKRWSFMGLVITDMLQRATPWSALIWSRALTPRRSRAARNDDSPKDSSQRRDRKKKSARKEEQAPTQPPRTSGQASERAPTLHSEQAWLPNDLNLSLSQRISTLLILLVLVHIAFFIFVPNLVLLPLLITFAVLCASCWHWEDANPIFSISPRKEPLIFGSVALICVLALWNNQLPMLAPFVFLVPLLVMGNWLTRTSVLLERFFYISMIVAFAAAFGLLLFSYPLLLWIPTLLALLAIVILNRRLYLFFVRKRGVLFALAAFPMQLLYYLYSFFIFLGVGIAHLWNAAFHRHS